MWQTIRSEGYWQGEIWNRRKDGGTYLQLLTITCVENESGETTHYVGDGHDLTQQKQGEMDHAAILAAQTVQRALFPAAAPRTSDFDIAGAVHPAERVSGDFFDYIPLGQDSIGILVADVSGHGLGPALLMAQTQAFLRALAESCADPAELLARANRLFTTSESGHFVTAFLGRLDAPTRSLIYACAGHQGYLLADDGTVKVLRSTSVPLGVEETIPFASAPAVIFEPGDLLLMPTDGIAEATNPTGEMFGGDRMLKVVDKNRNKHAAEIVDALFREARDFVGSRPQEDDMTAIVVKFVATTHDGG
jgi:sigma-B regulation protein RsbU (phosphoserine phosphatase)